MGLIAINENEMQEIDGGLIWFIVAGACLLLSSCGNGSGNQVNVYNGNGNHNTSHFKQDSVHNSSSAHGHLHIPLPVKK